jgi:MTH538 TIR-like domain (DUF1863)
MASRRHVFISHHHADDQQVSNLTDLLKGNGYEIRNSSIRAKPANQRRLDQGLVKDETIKRLLRMKMSWASTVIVLIGKETHTRPWVEWEINQAQKQGKRIIGVYEHGGQDFVVPEALENYADAIVGWNTESVVSAVEGGNDFRSPDGAQREPVHAPATSRC